MRPAVEETAGFFHLAVIYTETRAMGQDRKIHFLERSLFSTMAYGSNFLNNLREKAWVLAAILFISIASRAQTPSPTPPPAVERQITGSVKLAGQPAPKGLKVSLQIAFRPDDKNAGDEVARTETDAAGKFVFAHVELLGSHEGKEAFAVSAVYPGYNGDVKVVDLTSATSGEADLFLRKLVPEKNPVVSHAPAAPAVTPLSPNRPSKNPQAQEAMQQAEDLLFRKNDAKGSIEFLKKAVKLDPWYGPGYLLLGLAQMQVGNWSDAQWAFEEATKVEPGNARGYLGVGSALNEQGNYAAAQKALEKSLDIREDSAESHFEMARSLAAVGKWDAAEPHVRRAIELNPDYAGPHALMGNIALQAGDANTALDEFRTYLKLAPQGSLAPQVKSTISELEKALKGDQPEP
jgi:Tfp pilus assembly protein PilF